MSDDALVAALVEIERHVGHGGWDQPARLFALVPTADLVAAEPSLAAQLAPAGEDGAGGPPEGALSSIEQDGFHTGDDLAAALERIMWPDAVHGCALALERLFVPPHVEQSIPEDADAAERFVAEHPERRDVRVVVGVTRAGTRYGVARVRTEPGDLLAAEDLVPGLGQALSRTLSV